MQWRTHPGLQGKLHPDHPDDLQVIVHDGGPRVTQARPEAVWTRITAFDGRLFTGTVLNVPTQLAAVRQGQSIRFLIDAATGHAAMVTDKYLREKGAWKIGGCAQCGFAELFDAPSDLIRATFSNLPPGATPEAFTAFCPICHGVQTIEAVELAEPPAPARAAAKRAWWKFW